MENFAQRVRQLRKESGKTQTQMAAVFEISARQYQNYEGGGHYPDVPGLMKMADYFGVTTDYLLGRTLSRDGTTIVDAESLYDYSAEKDNVLRGSIMATLSKKLLVNSVGILFDLLGRTGSKEAIKAASDYLGTAVYRLFRHLYRAGGNNNEDFFAVPVRHFVGGLPNADMLCSEVDYVDALAVHMKEKGEFPLLNHDTLSAAYPGAYQSLLQIIHNTGERINHRMDARRADAR